MKAASVRELLPYLTPAERAELDKLLAADKAVWRPLPGPQQMAYESEADIIGFGGSAGGGKTDLACGKALTQHRQVMIMRRIGTELTAIEDRLETLTGSRDGYNSQKGIWRLRRTDGKSLQIELGSAQHAGDEKKYQGRPHDLLVFDEAVNFLEAQVRFLLTWLRTTTPGQRAQALLTFNPPQDAEGQWIIAFFAPWLDPKHPNPAKPGELRWFASVAGKDLEVEDGRPFVLVGDERVYDFDPADFEPDQIIQPLSRTFIPSRIGDNPFLLGTGYMAQLQALPEPLRSQMLHGDFTAGMEDDKWQVIPTAWVAAAQERWEQAKAAGQYGHGPMDSLGVDVARGGRDETIIARRHGTWFDEALAFPGTETPDGPAAASHVIMARRDRAPVHIDIIGWGASPFDFLNENGVHTVGVNGSEKSWERAEENDLPFRNKRAEVWWRMREALDPRNPAPIALPPDTKLKADLCAPRYKVSAAGIQVEEKAEIIKRIGRSPDRGDAYCMALIATPKIEERAPRKERPPLGRDGWMG